MMKQYQEIKKQYSDCLLFFRMGDFYELFLDDAYIGAKVLNITLTGKANGKDGRIPMAGVPYHAVDIYLSKLVKAGYKVAICEQVSEPNKYGIVDREVIRIVTPGTVLDEQILDKKENNYVMALLINKKDVGIAIADVSTGQFLTDQFPLGNIEEILRDELARIQPAECIIAEEDYNNPYILKILKSQKNLNIFTFKDWQHFETYALKEVQTHFGIKTTAAFGFENKSSATKVASILLGYLKYTQKDNVSHIKKIDKISKKEYMFLDKSTVVNLELFSTIREHDHQGSLIFLLDQTTSPMGGRMLREWIRKPLIDTQKIIERHEAVELYCKNNNIREKLRKILQEVGDIERLLSKLSVGIGNARDLVNIKKSLEICLLIKEATLIANSSLLETFRAHIDDNIQLVIDIIGKTIVDEPPIVLKAGRMIRNEVNKELDILKDEVSGCRNWLTDFEKQERERTGITTLKVRFNEVFGFFIEISKANAERAPNNYIRKQTMVNGERFITKELKEKEELILSAEEKINAIEYEIYSEVLMKVLVYTSHIQKTAESIGVLDCILNFAHLAQKNGYVKPVLLYNGEIHIKNGRHAVVEIVLEGEQFVPNGVTLNHKDHQLLVITGPNMAGKSVFIRQIALIVLLSQIGSFVPAESAELSIVDRIFVRSGASDVITSGLSTFMVEMVETAQILNTCTADSLIVMDEIGRGTSTYDGISIAWAVAEYLANQNKRGPKTLFATHYHELQKLAEKFPDKIQNYHMAVERKDQPIFLHTLLPGPASHSYGVDVAKLAGIPDTVTTKAWSILKELEKQNTNGESSLPHSDKSTTEKREIIAEEIRSLDIDRLTPIEAMNILASLKKKVIKQ
jgi:DNA mismatch repair protein MutS